MNRSTKIFIQENVLENIVCEMVFCSDLNDALLFSCGLIPVGSTHTLQGYVTDTEAIIPLPQSLLSHPGNYGYMSELHTPRTYNMSFANKAQMQTYFVVYTVYTSWYGILSVLNEGIAAVLQVGVISISNTLRPRQNGRHFPDDIFKCIFLNENVWISIKISLKFVPKGSIDNIPALVQIMAWRRPGAKPLSELMMVSLLTYICVTRPQWVKYHEVRLSNSAVEPITKLRANLQMIRQMD